MRRLWPHLCLALNLALLVIVILDVFNPLLGLLKGGLFLLFLLTDVFCSVVTALQAILRQAEEEPGPKTEEEKESASA